MGSNTFGKIFKVTNWGESHGSAIGVVVDGCPPQLEIGEKDIQIELDRRRPGQSDLTTPRKEPDKIGILSGIFHGKTTGAPISMIIYNKDYNKRDYTKLKVKYRPSHADFTYEKKYGLRDPFGGGRSSARVTAGHVAAGAIAKYLLKKCCSMEIIAYVKKIKDIEAGNLPEKITRELVEASKVRCPDQNASKKMVELIEKANHQGDSLGGVIECIITHVPIGLGDPLFAKLDARLALAMMNINATKAFEIGSGFAGTAMYGSQHNDPFIVKHGRVMTKTNHSGGVQGGITNGMPIVFRVGFKPTSTIKKKQKTIDRNGKEVVLEARGRHDPCVVQRAVPIVEAMAALVLVDAYLYQKTQQV